MRQSRRSFDKNAYRAKLLFIGISISAGLTFFQNCAKVLSPSNRDSKITEVGPLQTTLAVEILSLTAPQAAHPPLNSPGGPIVYVVSANGSVSKKFYEMPQPSLPGSCQLSTVQKNQLQSYLQNSSICFYEAIVAPNTICTLSYSYPYFVVHSGGITYEFGKMTSGCGDTFELCEPERTNFKNFISNLRMDLDQNCP